MRIVCFRLVAGLVLCCSLWGCDRPDEAEAVAPSAIDPTLVEKAGMDYLKEQEETGRLRVEAMKRQVVLRNLGPVAKWDVSTDRDGKPDDALVKAKKDGVYDAILDKAFSDRGLKLRFFTGLPAAIKGLRAAEPRPDACDLICEVPPAWKDLEPMLDPECEKTSDTDSSGRPREWRRYADVSLGVVNDTVPIVRLHLNSKTRGWEFLER
jgi:hypothetical protein